MSVSDIGVPVVLRIGMDGVLARVPFVADERGAGRLLREQIGCSLFDVIALDDGVDMWVDDEAIVGIDLGDRAALSEAVNVVASWIANQMGRRGPVFGAVVITALDGERTAALTTDQLDRVERLADLSAAAVAEVLGVREAGAR